MAVLNRCVIKMATTSGASPLDVSFVRSFMNLVTAAATMWSINQSTKVPSELVSTLATRVACGFVAFNCNVFAVAYLPLALMSVIFNTSPFWSGLFGYFILKESMT